MGATNEKEKTQAIAYQRDLLGACWNSPYGVQEAQTFISSRWCGVSQLLMEYNTGHKCVALQAHRAPDAKKLEEHLDVVDNAAVAATTLVVGGDESFGEPEAASVASPLRRSPTTTFPTGFPGSKDDATAPAKRRLGLPKASVSEEHLGSTIDLMLLQQRTNSALPGGTGVSGSPTGHISVPPSAVVLRDTSKPQVISTRQATITSAATGTGGSFASNGADRADGHGGSGSAGNGSFASDATAGTLRKVVRDTQVVESATHNHQLYLRAYGLSVHQDVVFRAAPAHRRYDCIGLVATCAPDGLASLTSLRSFLPPRRDGSAGATPGHASRLPSPMRSPRGGMSARRHSGTVSPSHSCSGEVSLNHSMSGNHPNASSTKRNSNNNNDDLVHLHSNKNDNDSGSPTPQRESSAVLNNSAPAPPSLAHRSQPSKLRRPSSITRRPPASSRAHNTGYVEFATNPIHPRYNYQLTDTEFAIPSTRVRAPGEKGNGKDDDKDDTDLGSYAADTAPFIVGSISALELQTLPHNAEVCLGGWLYISLEDEQKRLRRVLDNYEEFLRNKQAEQERRAAEMSSSAPSGGRSPMPRSKRPSRLPSPALGPQRGPSPGLKPLGASLPPSALMTSKTTGSFPPPSSLRANGTGAATTDMLKSDKSTGSPNNTPKALPRSHSFDGLRPSAMATPALSATPSPAQRDQAIGGPNSRFMNSYRPADDPLAPEDFWVPHAYLILAMPMYECSINPTAFHTINNRTKPVSLNIVNPLSREAFGVGCISGIRYGGVIVLECREPVTVADKDWLLALKKLGEQAQAMATESAMKAAAAAAVPRDLSVSASARLAAEEAARVGAAPSGGADVATPGTTAATPPSLTADALERSVLLPFDAPLRDADLAWLQRKRADKMRFLRRALRGKLRKEGFSVIFAYTRTSRRQRRAAARRARDEMIRADEVEDEGRHTPVHPLSLDVSLVPNSNDDEPDDVDGNADGDDQDDTSTDDDVYLDDDSASSHSTSSQEADLGNTGRDGDPFAQRGPQWLASAAQDAQSPANYTIKGTFRQIGGVRYFDTAALLDGCGVRDVVDGTVRWARNLRRMPIKARPLSLFLQRYEGISQALRIAQGSATRAVIQALYRTGAPANVLLQANGSFSRNATATAGAVPTDSFSPGTVAGSFSFTQGAASPASPLPPGVPNRQVFPFTTYYTGPLDPIVRAILSPEVEHMIRAAEEGVIKAEEARRALVAGTVDPYEALTGKSKGATTAAAAAAALPAVIDVKAGAPQSQPPQQTSAVAINGSATPSTRITDIAVASRLDGGVPLVGNVNSPVLSAAGSAPSTVAASTGHAPAQPPKTIEAMLAGPAVVPLGNNSIIAPLTSPSGAMVNASFTNASFTNNSFVAERQRALQGSVAGGTAAGDLLASPPSTNGTFAIPESALTSFAAGTQPPHVMGAPTVQNNTFILQTGACVQRPPERYVASPDDGPDKDPKREKPSSGESASSRASGRDTADLKHGDDDEEDEDEPHALNQTLRLSQIALDAVREDDRAGRSKDWLEADAALRQVKAELEEMRFLVSNADTELEQRIQEYVTMSSLFLPHTRVDQTALVLLSVKMLRQFPDDVPVKELHSDWLPLLLATLTLPNDHVFVTERTLTVRDHQAQQLQQLRSTGGSGDMPGRGAAEYVVHGQDSVYGHLMPPQDVCDANKRREAFNDAETTSKYAIEAIRPLPLPQPLHEIVIAPIPYRITSKTARALEQQGVDTTYSFCFTGGSLGVLAGVLRVYGDAMRTRCQAEIKRVMAAGGPAALRAEARNSTELLIKSGYNVFLRRIWIWGSASKKKPGFFHKLFGIRDNIDDTFSEVGTGEDAEDDKKRKKQKRKKARKSADELDGAPGSFTSFTNDSMTSTAGHDRHGNVKRIVLPYRLSEAYALFDAIMQYLRTYRDMEKDFRAAANSDADPNANNGGAASTANAAAPRKRRSFLQPRRVSVPAAAPSVDELSTEDLLVTDFEVCVATNYYYKRGMVEQAYRQPGVLAPSATTTAANTDANDAAGASPKRSTALTTATTSNGAAHRMVKATPAVARRLLTKHEEQRRAHQLGSLVLRHTERRREAHKLRKKREAALEEMEASRKDASEREPMHQGRSGGGKDAAPSKRERKRASKRWHAMAAEVEVPYCGGEEEEKPHMQDDAKGLYDFLEVSLERWRDARLANAGGGGGVLAKPKNEVQDSCATPYERVELEKMVKTAVKLSLS